MRAHLLTTKDRPSLDCCSGSNTNSFTFNAYDSSTGFVPRLEAAIGLTYDLSQNWSVGVLYKFDGLWKLTSPNQQAIAPCSTTTCVADSDLKLRNGNKLYMNTLGLTFIGRF